MRVLSRSTLRDFWADHPDAEEPLTAWFGLVERSDWAKPEDVRDTVRTADILPDNRVVFNVLNNRYRVVVKIHYNTRIVYIRFVGTHAQYDRIDATTT